MKTKFLGLRKPTAGEKKKGAEVVFLHEGQDSKTINVFGAVCYESWEQWGAPLEVLQNNCQNIEKWRKHQKN